MRLKIALVIFIMTITGFTTAAYAQITDTTSPYSPTKGNIENRQWFEQAKLGLFIHFGIYTQLDDPDEAWAMRKYTISQYTKFADSFNPKDFNAKKWVAQAKALGFTFITITAKHHDGFCLFDSKYTHWTIMHHGYYRHDLIKDIVHECHQQGMHIFLYYSLLDWHHPDFVFHKEDGGIYKYQTSNPHPDEQKYIQYMENQLTELLTHYGKIDGIWFDGYWSKNTDRWPFDKIYGLIHHLQPACMIGNNHDMFYIPGEDYAIYALYDPFPQAGYDKDTRLQEIPLEAMDMSSDKWGYYSKQVYKSAQQIIHNQARVTARKATFLLNTGPLPDGQMDPRFIDTMKVVQQK